MKVSNFFLTKKVISSFSNTTEKHLIDLIFPESDFKPHLVLKLQNCIDRSYYELGLLWFYESLDLEYKDMFDKWFDTEVTELKQKYESL